MAKKKLLIYAHYYIPDTASTGQILRELAEGMLDKFDITVICVVPSYLGTIEDMIPMYDLERTICDLMRSRSSIEAQDFNSILKTYVSRRDKDLNRLMEYAKLFRVDNVIRKYMGVLL